MTEAVWIVLIANLLGVIGIWIKAAYDARTKKHGNNPHPCKDHADKLKELDEKLDTIGERVSRIEGKLNNK